ncbi:MAG: hypothetical protein F4Y51_00255 [Cenarchaeum sp. SB0664_bin_35]|nr:hypothetical protein [Cenarchaeum sp. SB0664_bin_35]
MSFEERLQRGEFCVAYCHNCKIVVWPHLHLCNQCFSATELVPHTTHGTLTEYSSRDGIIFCICRVGEIHIMGRLLSWCAEASPVRIARCGIDGGVPFLEFEPDHG